MRRILAMWLLFAAGSSVGMAHDCKPNDYDRDTHCRKHHPTAAPEISASSGLAALLLIAGGLAIMYDRRHVKVKF